MRRQIALALVALVLALFLSGCTQWGTSPLRTVDVWWACRDKNASCSPDDAGLTYIQMSNTLAGVGRDLGYAERSCPEKARKLRLRELYGAAIAAQRLASGRAWTPELADFTRATVTAERAAAKTWGCKETRP